MGGQLLQRERAGVAQCPIEQLEEKRARLVAGARCNMTRSTVWAVRSLMWRIGRVSSEHMLKDHYHSAKVQRSTRFHSLCVGQPLPFTQTCCSSRSGPADAGNARSARPELLTLRSTGLCSKAKPTFLSPLPVANWLLAGLWAMLMTELSWPWSETDRAASAARRGSQNCTDRSFEPDMSSVPAGGASWRHQREGELTRAADRRRR